MTTVPTVESPVADAKSLFARIFVPIDFSLSSQRAFGAALELKRLLGSEICLFHCAEARLTDEFLGGLGSPAPPMDLTQVAEHRLRDFVANVAPAFVGKVEVRTRPEMNLLEDLKREARRWRASLVVASADFRAGLFRSPAEKIVHGFDIPVLLIPAITPRREIIRKRESLKE